MSGLNSDGFGVPHPGDELLTSGAPPRDLWGRLRGAHPAALLLVGLLVGGGAGAGAVLASSDPTKSSEYRTVEQQLKTTEAQVAAQKAQAEVAQRVAAAATADARELRQALVMGQLPGELRQAAHP